MADKLALGLAEILPAALASVGIIEGSKDKISQEEPFLQSMGQGGLFRVARKYLEKPGNYEKHSEKLSKIFPIAELPSSNGSDSQQIDLQSQDDEYDDVIDDSFMSDDELLGEQPIIDIEPEVQNPEEDPPPPPGPSYSQQFRTAFERRIYQLIDQLDYNTLKQLYAAILGALGNAGYHGIFDKNGNLLPEPHNQKQREQIEEAKKRRVNLNPECIPHYYFEEDKLMQFVICPDGKMSVRDAL